MPANPIDRVLDAHRARLLSLPGVVGVARAQSQGRPCIQVYVSDRSPDLVDRVPATLEGYPVRIQESGEFQALDE